MKLDRSNLLVLRPLRKTLRDDVVLLLRIDVEAAAYALGHDEGESSIQYFRDGRTIDFECHCARQEPSQTRSAIPIRHTGKMHHAKEYSDFEATYAGRENLNRQGEHVPETPLMPKLVHLLDPIEAADSGGPRIVQIVLPKTPVSHVEVCD